MTLWISLQFQITNDQQISSNHDFFLDYHINIKYCLRLVILCFAHGDGLEHPLEEIS